MSMIKRSMATIDGLGKLSDLDNGIINTSLVAAINSVNSTALSGGAGVGSLTVADKATSFTATTGMQVFVSNDGDSGWAIYRVTADISSSTINASTSSLLKLMDQNALWNEFTAGQITAIESLVTNVTATAAVDLDALVAAVALNTAKVSNVSTNLTSSVTATTVTVESSDGTDVTLSAASATDAGLLTAAQFTKLAGIESGATADMTSAEIKTAYELNANTNAYTDSEKSKLAGIEAGANNYTLPVAGASLGGIKAGTDITIDAQGVATVTAAAVTAHQSSLTIAESQVTGLVGKYELAIATKGTAFNKNFGSTSGTVAEGSDTRIVNGATAYSWGDHASAGYLTTVTQAQVVAYESALTIAESQVTGLTGKYVQIAGDTVVRDNNYAHITVGANSVTDGTNTFTGKSYTIVTESLVVASGQITLTGTPVGNALLNFNTARHTTGGISSDYTVTYVSGSVFTIDAELNGQGVAVQYMKLV